MKRWLLLTADALLFAGVVYVGYLQSRHINAGFWTKYGGDVIGPVWLYSALRQLKIYRKRYPSPEITAGGVFAACFLWEWCQRYDLRGTVLGITRGSFDPYDVLSYAASLALAYAVDKTFQWQAKALQPTGARASFSFLLWRIRSSRLHFRLALSAPVAELWSFGNTSGTLCKVCQSFREAAPAFDGR